MVIGGICDRLKKVPSPCGLPAIDEGRFLDTLSMVCDEDDPHGLSFINMFFQECEKDLSDLEASLGDLAAMSNVCHKWIGRCAQLGMTGLGRLGKVLHSLVKGAASKEDLKEVIINMALHLEQVQVAINAMAT